MTAPIHPLPIPSLLIAGTAHGVGKTVVAAAIADWLKRDRVRTSVMKPFDTACEHRREGWVSEDAEFLAAASETGYPLDLICPVRSGTKLPPALADEPVAWELVDRAASILARDADVMVVEATTGLLDPIDSSNTMLDVARVMGSRAVLVVQANQPLNLAMIHLLALRASNVPVAGVVINRYPPGTATTAEELFLRSIEKLGRTRVLAIVPDESVSKPALAAGIADAIGKVDWLAIAKGR